MYELVVYTNVWLRDLIWAIIPQTWYLWLWNRNRLFWKGQNRTRAKAWGNQTFGGQMEEGKLAKGPEKGGGGWGRNVWLEGKLKESVSGGARSPLCGRLWGSQWVGQTCFWAGKPKVVGSLVKSHVHGWQTQTSDGTDGRGGGGEEGEMMWELALERNFAGKGSREVTVCLTPEDTFRTSGLEHMTLFQDHSNRESINGPSSNICSKSCEFGETFC